MKTEEAIDILKSKMDGSVDTSYEWAEALRMSIEALEKQIPMPVRRTTSTKRCGRCNRQLSWSMNTQPSKRYCPRCGQALDWEA